MKTSGKWTFDGNSVLDNKGRNVCTKVNGHLIAALPELLHASKAYLDQSSVSNRGKLRAAIAKAEYTVSAPVSDAVANVRKQVMAAYADAHENGLSENERYKQRNLSFRASMQVTRDEAIAIMGAAIDNGYNEFDAKLLRHLPADAQILIAREGSVCIYVKGVLSPSLQDTMKADEFDYYPPEVADFPNFTRIWWD